MSKNKYLSVFPSLVLALGISACSNEQQETGQVNEGEPSIGGESVVEAESVQLNENKSETTGFSTSSINMADYKIVDFSTVENLDWLTPFLLANTSQEISDEDKVRLFSDEYNSEVDGFKKKDMFDELLPKVEQEIKDYRNAKIILKVPVKDSSSVARLNWLAAQNEKGYLTLLSSAGFLNRYNFDAGGFEYKCEIGMHELDNSHGVYNITNKNSITIRNIFDSKFADKLICDTDGLKRYGEPELEYLDVGDEGLARKIEEVVIAGGLSIVGDTYYIAKVLDNEIYAIPLRADLEFVNRETNEVLMKKQLNFKWKG